MRKWGRHSVEFKKQAVEKMRTCDNIAALARKLKIEKKLLYSWKWQLEGRPEPRHANLKARQLSRGPRVNCGKRTSG